MAWKDVTAMSQREEFVVLASAEGANVSALCGRFGVSRKTGYKWLARYAAEGSAGLVDQSRRPWVPAGQTSVAWEQRVLAMRVAHPAWGGRKLRRRLLDLRVAEVPAANRSASAPLRSPLRPSIPGPVRPEPNSARQPRRLERPPRPPPRMTAPLLAELIGGHFPLASTAAPLVAAPRVFINSRPLQTVTHVPGPNSSA